MTKKNKNIALIVGFILGLVIAYQFAIGDTFALKSNLNTLKKEQAVFSNAPQKLGTLKQKERFYDSILNANNINSSSIQNELLRTLSNLSDKHKLKITSFVEPHRFDTDDFAVITYSFSVTGTFNNIQLLLHHLEQNTAFGELSNVHYKKERDYRRRRDYLQASVLLKRYEK